MMATKAELEAELRALKASLASQEKTPGRAPEPEPTPAPEASARASLEEMLGAHGIAPEDITTLWDQFTEEFGDLPHQKPLLTAIAAFGLGFVLGRMSRS